MDLEKLQLGLPDFIVLDNNGEISETKLQHFLGVFNSQTRKALIANLTSDKNKRKELSKHDNPFLTYFSFPFVRVKSCMNALSFLQRPQVTRSNNVRQHISKIPSIEVYLLDDYIKGFYKDRASDEDREWFNSRGFLIDSTENEKILSCVIKVAHSLSEDLSAWTNKTADEKRILAGAFFSVWVLLGDNVAQYFLDICPDLATYFTYMESVASTNPPNLAGASAPVVENWESFFKKLSIIVGSALDSSPNLELIEQLESLVTTKAISALKEESKSPSIKDVISKIASFAELWLKVLYTPYDELPCRDVAPLIAWEMFMAENALSIEHLDNIQALLLQHISAIDQANSDRLAKMLELDTQRQKVTALLEGDGAALSLSERKELKDRVQDARTIQRNLEDDVEDLQFLFESLFYPKDISIEVAESFTDKYHVEYAAYLKNMLSNISREVADHALEVFTFLESYPFREETAVSASSQLNAQVPSSIPVNVSNECADSVSSITDGARLVIAPELPDTPSCSNSDTEVVAHDSEGDQIESDKHVSEPELEMSPITSAATTPTLSHQPEPEPKHVPPQNNDVQMPNDSNGIIADSVVHYLKDHNAISTQVLNELKLRGEIQAESINNLVIRFIRDGYLNAAYWTLKSAAASKVVGTYLPLGCIEAAYYGQHVWSRQDASLLISQRLLNTIHPSPHLSDWFDNKPSGRITPFLMFAATLQPALFGGNGTNAPNLLGSCSAYLDDAFQLLAKDVLNVANKGIHLTLNDLSKNDDSREIAESDIKDAVNKWQLRLSSLTKGYSPLLRAMKRNIDVNGEFGKIIAIIMDNKKESQHLVREFVERYSEHTHIEALLDSLIGSVNSNFNNKVIGNGKVFFMRCTSDLVGLANQWLILCSGSQSAFQNDIKMFSSRFDQHIQGILDKTVSNTESTHFEVEAGWQLIANMLRRIQTAIEQNKPPVMNDDHVKARLQMPLDVVNEKGTKYENEELIAALAKRLPIGFNASELFSGAIETRNLPLAYLMLDEQQRSNSGALLIDERDALEKMECASMEALVNQLNECRNLLDNAVLAGLLNDDDQFLRFQGELDIANIKLTEYHAYVDTREIEETLSGVKGHLVLLLNSRVVEQRKDYDLLLRRASVENDVVIPDRWTELLETAFSEKNISVIAEMLVDLEDAAERGGTLSDMETNSYDFAGDFLAASPAIIKILGKITNHRDTKRIFEESVCDVIDIVTRSKEKATIIGTLKQFEANKAPKMNQDLYNRLVSLLKQLGIDAEYPQYRKPFEDDYRHHGIFSEFKLNVLPPSAGKPFHFMGSKFHGSIMLYCFWGKWDRDLLKSQVADVLASKTKKESILLSFVPVDNKLRSEFAQFCRKQRLTMLLVDPVNLLYLLGTDEKYGTMRTIDRFLRLTIPFTYCNPYSGGEFMLPPPVEMRFGREHEVLQLTESTNGAAIIYGGRQLGKSTILEEVKRSFDGQDNHYAHMLKMDGYVDRITINQDHWGKSQRQIWKSIFDFFVVNDLVSGLQQHESSKDMLESLARCFNTNAKLRVIIIMDEIDKVLETDSSYDFQLFRDLRDLVNRTESRFKVIICGLNNVRRFEGTPNYPLKQLGKSLAVSIMPSTDALNLVQIPLNALGYHFESVLVANRILSLTNRHPGLIQAFCHELVDYLSNNPHFNTERRIDNADINKVFKKESVQKEIIDRFNITLDLDKRYVVIVYSLILEGYGAMPFNTTIAKEAAGAFLPIFENYSEKQFEAILDELIGLGVLKRSSLDTGSYSIRNTNVLNLLMSRSKDIEDSLLRANESYEDTDPLAYHRCYVQPGSGFRFFSPLSLGDERQILGVASREVENELYDPSVIAPPKATVSFVFGSVAHGIKDFSDTVSGFDNIDFSIQNEACYKVYEKPFSDVKDTSTLLSRLDSIKSKSNVNANFFLIHVDDSDDCTDVLNAFDVVLNKLPELSKSPQPVRVMFTLSPGSLWKWISMAYDRYKPIEENQIAINLRRWDRNGVAGLLRSVELMDSIDHVNQVLDYTGGWFCNLKEVAKQKSKNNKIDNALSLPDLPGVDHMSPKQAVSFLSMCGINDVPWALPLLNELMINDMARNLDVEHVELCLESADFVDVLPASALLWLIRLQIVRPLGQGNYCIDACVESALKSTSN